jgi:hypothetical protein
MSRLRSEAEHPQGLALTWGGAWNLARTGGDAVAALRQTADRHAGGTAHDRQEGDVGTASATPAEQTTLPPLSREQFRLLHFSTV